MCGFKIICMCNYAFDNSVNRPTTKHILLTVWRAIRSLDCVKTRSKQSTIDSVKSPRTKHIFNDIICKEPKNHTYYCWQSEGPNTLTQYYGQCERPQAIFILVDSMNSPRANLYYYWQCLRSNCIIIDSVKSPSNMYYNWQREEPVSNMYYCWQCEQPKIQP